MNESGSTADEQAPRVFVDPTEEYSLHMPEGWLVDTSGQQGSCVILYGPTVEDGFRANVNVVVQDLAPLTAEEYLTLSRLQLRKLSNLPTLPVDEPPLHVPGGQVLEWTTWEAEIPVRARQLIAFRGGKAFILTAKSTASSFGAYEPFAAQQN